jgi:hypothetical protein
MTSDVTGTVWDRLRRNNGAVFETATGLKFQLLVDGNGLWIFREGQIINRRLTKKHLDRAIGRCPLHLTTDIRDCLGPSYLFGILMDSRIRNGIW